MTVRFSLSRNLLKHRVMKAYQDVLHAALVRQGEAIVQEAVLYVQQQVSGRASGRLERSLAVIDEGDTVKVGTDLPYAVYVECGTAHTAAKPFLRPAYEASREHVIRSVAKDLQHITD